MEMASMDYSQWIGIPENSLQLVPDGGPSQEEMYWQRPAVANVTDVRPRSCEQQPPVASAFNDVHISHAACSISAPTKTTASLLCNSIGPASTAGADAAADDAATVRIAVKNEDWPKVTDVVNICDQQSVEEGLIVRRRTIITLGERRPSMTPTSGHQPPTSGISVTLKSADQQPAKEVPLMLRASDSDVRSLKILAPVASDGADAEPAASKMSAEPFRVHVRSVKRDKAWYERRQTYGFEASNSLKMGDWNGDYSADAFLVKSAANNFGEVIPPWMKMSAPVGQDGEKGKSASDLSAKVAEKSSDFWEKISQQSEPTWLRELKLRRSLRERLNEEGNKPEPQVMPWINVKLRPTGVKLYEEANSRKRQEADHIPYALKLPEISEFSAPRGGPRDLFLINSDQHSTPEPLEHRNSSLRRSSELVKIVEESPPVSADFTDVPPAAAAANGENAGDSGDSGRTCRDYQITSLKSPMIVNEIVNFDAAVERKIVILETEKGRAPKGILKKRAPWPQTLRDRLESTDGKWPEDERSESHWTVQVDSSRSTTPESDELAEAEHSESSEPESAANLTPISESSTETGADVSDVPLAESAPEESAKCKDLGYHSLERETGRKCAAVSAQSNWIQPLKTGAHQPEPNPPTHAAIPRKLEVDVVLDHKLRAAVDDKAGRSLAKTADAAESDKSARLTSGMCRQKAAQLVREYFDNQPPMRFTSTRPVPPVADRPVPAVEKPVPPADEAIPSANSSSDVSNCDISFDELVQLCELSDLGSDFDAFFGSLSDDEDSSAKLDRSGESLQDVQPESDPPQPRRSLVSKIPLPIRCLNSSQVKIPPLATSSPVESNPKELQWRRVQTLKNSSRIPMRSAKSNGWKSSSSDDVSVHSAIRVKSKSQLSLSKSTDPMKTSGLRSREKSDFFAISKIAGEKIFISFDKKPSLLASTSWAEFEAWWSGSVNRVRAGKVIGRARSENKVRRAAPPPADVWL